MRLAEAFSSSESIVALLNAVDGRFLDVNLAFERITGYGRDTVIGRIPLEVGLWRDPEFRTYLRLLAIATAIYTAALWFSSYVDDPARALRLALFQAVSMQTTSGFVTDNFTHWPGALPVLLLLSALYAGSLLGLGREASDATPQ